MPSVADSPPSAYLPTLERCLAGEARLISWALAHEALTSPEIASSTGPLQRLLSEDISIKALTHSLEATKPGNGQTKADFETRTASINGTPSDTGNHDVTQIKTDSLWLSKLFNIDEITALRSVLLEWQDRPAADILEGYSEEETISLRQTVGTLTDFTGSAFAASFVASNGQASSREKEEKKRQSRILQTHFKEHERLMAVAVFLETAHTLEPPDQPEWLLQAAGKVADARAGVMGTHKAPAQRLLRLVEAFERHLQVLGGEGASDLPEDVNPTVLSCQQTCRLLEGAHILRSTYLEAKSTSHLRSIQGIAAWYRIMDTYGFLQTFQVTELDQQTIVEIIQSLASLISVQVLDLANARDLLQSDSVQDAASWYVFDNECCRQICGTLSRAASNEVRIAAPALLCWSVIGVALRASYEAASQRLSDSEDGSRSPVLSRSDGTPLGDARQNFQEIETPLNPSDKDVGARDPVMYLAEVAISGSDVFGLVAGLSTIAKSIFGPGFSRKLELRVRQTLLDVIRQGASLAFYGADILESALAVLRPGPATAQPSDADVQIAVEFLTDPELSSALLHQAERRYPLELAALLRLFDALSAADIQDQDGMPVLTQRLQNASTFTLQMPQHFNDYELGRDGGIENTVRLTKDLSLFANSRPNFSSNSLMSTSQQLVLANSHNPLVIAKGTIGRALNDTRPFVGLWEHEHSIFAYLSALLATALPSSQTLSVALQDTLGRDLQAGIISLFTSQIRSLLRDSPGTRSVSDSHQMAKLILEEASDSLPQDQDIISSIGDIFEAELAAQPLQSGDASVDVLAACVSFMQAVLPVIPDRVWPQLARIGLVDTDDRGSKLSIVILSIEIISERYSFLLGCLSLFDALAQDVIRNAVVRQGQSNQSTSRFQESTSFKTGIPTKMMSLILESFTRLFLDILRSSHDWRFADINEKLTINIEVLSVFSKIVKAVHSIDDSRDDARKLSAPLTLAAKLLVDTHCGTAGDLSINAVIRLSIPTSQTSLDTVTTTAVLARKQSEGSLNFLTLLLQTADLSTEPATSLKAQLFQSVPALVRVYVGEPSQRVSVVRLLSTMVSSAAKSTDKEVPSLFGHLGADTAQKTVGIFSDLGKPLDDQDLEVAIWDMFSAVVSGRQQWFATFLLTGSMPNKAYKSDKKESKQQKAVLDQALDALADVGPEMHRREASMLNFVTKAVNNWPWSVGRLKSHPTFIDKMSSRLKSFDVKLRDASGQDAVNLAWHIRNVSLLNELFAMYLHHMRRMGSLDFGKRLAKNLWLFREGCVSDPAYATSLHKNLQFNLERKLPHCKLTSFKRRLPNNVLGPDFYYDVEYASQALSTHLNWHGKKRDSGFEAELCRANSNFSLVEAQIENLKSWKVLATEFSNYARDDVNLQMRLAFVVHECLNANRNVVLEVAIFESLAQIRAEMALPILQRLVEARSTIASMHSLLLVAWNAIGASEQDYDSILVGDDAEYYRKLIQLLLLAIQPHTYSQSPAELPDTPDTQEKEAEKVTTLLAITRDIVARGFKSLCSQVHEDPLSVLPADFSLLTTIFQSILRVQTRELSGLHRRVALVLTEQNLTRYASSLFSWSDRITAANDDPVYSEISMLFIYEMSTIPAIAEMLASDGILGQLEAANITSLYRRQGGSGPFDEPSRLFTTWSRGILPVCLNVLVAAGEAFGSEVVSFLNSFSPQMSRAATALDPKATINASTSNKGCITLNTACEVHTLALISVALERGGQESLDWDRIAVKDDVDRWVHGTRAALRERIMPTTDKELAFQRTKPTGRDKDLCGCESRLEEMVLHELKGALFVMNGGG